MSGLQLPFAIVANLEKNIELAKMALQLAKTLAPWFFQASTHFHIIVVASIILCSPDICVYPPFPVIFLRTTKSTPVIPAGRPALSVDPITIEKAIVLYWMPSHFYPDLGLILFFTHVTCNRPPPLL